MDKSEFNRRFGALLKKKREKKSLSQSELARRCLKDRQYIHSLENGQITPTFFTVYILCNELEADITELFPLD